MKYTTLILALIISMSVIAGEAPKFSSEAPAPFTMKSFDITANMTPEEVSAMLDKQHKAFEEAMEAQLEAAEKMLELKAAYRDFELQMDKQKLEQVKKNQAKIKERMAQRRAEIMQQVEAANAQAE